MSIKNLLTDNVKPDQTLKVESLEAVTLEIENLVVENSEINGLTVGTIDASQVNSLTYGVYFQDFPSEDFSNGEVTVQASCGYIRFNNAPNLASNNSFIVDVHYPPVEPNAYCVLVSGVQLGAGQNVKLAVDVHSISSGTFQVIITNFSSTTFTNTSFAFNYLVLRGISP